MDKKTQNKKSKLENIRRQLFEIGKLPPQAIELEEAVLGALMLDKESLTIVMDILVPNAFYKEAHTRIYKAIVSLFRKGEPIDILTVTQALKHSEELEIVGGPYYITQLTNRVASAANSEYHARIIQQKYIQRELIRVSTEAIKVCYEDSSDVFDSLDALQNNILNIIAENIKSQVKDTTEISSEFLKNLEKIANNNEDITGVPCTIQEINKITKGWQPSDLIIVAARPAMGKTAFTKTLIKGAISKNIPVAMFSLEMSSMQLFTRLISEDVEVNSDAFRTKEFLNRTSFEQINKAIAKYYTDNRADLLYIDDTPALKINELRARAKLLWGKHKIGLIIVDYLQLTDASDDSGNREQEISKVSRGLKTLARELNIPIIALSQLNRGVEKKADKLPQLSDIRESGAIEQDADMVIFLHRPEYYIAPSGAGGEFNSQFETIEYKGENISTAGLALAIIAKHRNGALGNVAMRFKAQLTQFSDWESQHPSPTTAANPNQFLESKKEENNFLQSGQPFEEEPPF